MKYAMFVGGYDPEGISRVVLRDGRLKRVDVFPADNPSYLCIAPNLRQLYAVGEFNDARANVQSFDIAANGILSRTSACPVAGLDPCHLSVCGSILLTANYSSGSVSRFRLNPDGTIGEALPILQFHESGPDTDRQRASHLHQVMISGEWIYMPDLGGDCLHIMRRTAAADETPKLFKLNVPRGYGPRHCVRPNGDLLYVACELKNLLLVYRGTPTEATLVGRSYIGTGDAPNAPAALRLSPNGQMLLATGRGQNTLTLFSLSANGMPTLLSEVSSGGDWPRDAQFTPDGKYIVCANQFGDCLTAFEIVNGKPVKRSELGITAPSCILFTEQEGC